MLQDMVAHQVAGQVDPAYLLAVDDIFAGVAMEHESADRVP